MKKTVCAGFIFLCTVLLPAFPVSAQVYSNADNPFLNEEHDNDLVIAPAIFANDIQSAQEDSYSDFYAVLGEQEDRVFYVVQDQPMPPDEGLPVSGIYTNDEENKLIREIPSFDHVTCAVVQKDGSAYWYVLGTTVEAGANADSDAPLFVKCVDDKTVLTVTLADLKLKDDDLIHSENGTQWCEDYSFEPDQIAILSANNEKARYIDRETGAVTIPDEELRDTLKRRLLMTGTCLAAAAVLLTAFLMSRKSRKPKA